MLIVLFAGKNYVFDIQRTMQEAYEHTRRRLYKMEKEGECACAGAQEGAEPLPGGCCCASRLSHVSFCGSLRRMTYMTLNSVYI